VKLLGKGPRLDKAYALEAMADEMGFIVGPLIVVPLAVSVGASTALIVALAFTVVASAILVLQRAPEPGAIASGPATDYPDVGRSVMAIRGMQVLTGSLLFLGIVFGAVEIVLVAFAEANEWPGSASIMASTFALGSFLGAVIYGAITWNIPIDRRVKLALVWFTIGTIPMFLSTTVWQMTAAIFLTGLGISPALIAINGVVEDIAPPRKLNEAFTWIGSSLATGAAFGSLIIGVVLDELGLKTGQSVGVIGSIISLIVIYAFGRHIVASRKPVKIA
jgi:MFS family permease